MAHPSITMEFIPMPVTGKSSSWFSTFASIRGRVPGSVNASAHSRPVHGRRMAGWCVAGMETWPQRSRGLMAGVLQGSWGLGFPVVLCLARSALAVFYVRLSQGPNSAGESVPFADDYQDTILE
jgi:hypothetical protein